MQKLSVCLYSDYNFLALSVLENLLSKNSFVNILTDDVEEWAIGTEHIVSKTRFAILPKSKTQNPIVSNYAVYCGGFLKKENAYNGLNDFSKRAISQGTKALILMPFESYSRQNNINIRVNDNLSVVYLGDILGPRIDTGSDLMINRAVFDMAGRSRLTLAIGEIIYPIFVTDAARILIKWLFSFGPYGKETFLIGNPISATDFWKQNQRIIKNLTLVNDSESLPRILPRGHEIKRVDCNLPFILEETYRWMMAHWSEQRVNTRVKRKKIEKIDTPQKRLARKMLYSALFVLLLPFITLAISLAVSLVSYKLVLGGNTSGAQNSVLLARTFFTISRVESKALSYIPLLGLVYKETGFVSLAGEEIASLTTTLLPLSDTAGVFFDKVLGDEVYDSAQFSGELAAALDLSYRKASLIETEFNTSAEDGSLIAKKTLQKVDFAKIKNYLQHAQILSLGLPDILGKDTRKSYLVLFQNNMELRPTGGFIGSFGIATFDGGRLSDLVVNDVYSADGQLRGHVEPPLPIKNYLGEANWWLRDSNWDPDFPTSAQRAEWFLDKEMDQKVDGVVAVDLELVKDILKYTGPVFLPDYNLDITSENLYSETQSEVHEDFFPGTRKKASFLTALSRNLISEVEKLNDTKKLYVLQSIISSLDERHIQAYLHNETVQTAIARLNWSGQLKKPYCGEDCYADMVGIVEANVGVNKANYFLTRKINLDVNLNPDSIERNLSLELENSANPSLGTAGRYKVYLRFLIPEDAEVTRMVSTVGTSVQNISPEITDNKDRKEVGALVEILGGQRQAITITWRSKVVVSPEEYGIYVRKQAGTGDDPLSVSVLTGDGKQSYNTTLAKDFVWTNKYSK